MRRSETPARHLYRPRRPGDPRQPQPPRQSRPRAAPDADRLSASVRTAVLMTSSAAPFDAQNAALTLNEPNWYVADGRLPVAVLAVALLPLRGPERERRRGPQRRSLFSNAGTQNLSAGVYLRLGRLRRASRSARSTTSTAARSFDANTKTRGRSGPHFMLRDYLLRFISPCNCWAAEFGVSDTFNTDERLFRFQITLLGLGVVRSGSHAAQLRGRPRCRPGASGPGHAIGSGRRSYF